MPRASLSPAKLVAITLAACRRWPAAAAATLAKVLFSTALWCAAVLGAVRAWRQRPLRPLVVTLIVPLLYLLAVQANFLGTQRYFSPALPLPYLLATLGIGPGPASEPAAQLQELGSNGQRDSHV